MALALSPMKTFLSSAKKNKLCIVALSFLAILLLSGVTAQAATAASPSITLPKPSYQLGTSVVSPVVTLLDPTFNPQMLVGGAPFCPSLSLGTILCYPPNFLKTAYSFPSANNQENGQNTYQATYQGGNNQGNGLDGHGSTVVIVDAFGSPTIQSDLNTFDSTFGLPPTTVTILCGPTWTGAHSDNCPVKTVADLNTVPNGAICGGAAGWAEETTLDVTMVHALAPGARIVLVVANDCFDSSLYGAELAVVNQHQYRGSIMTQSFGEPDDLVTCTALDPTNTYCVSYDPTLLNLPNQVFQTAAQNHWTVLASSGDSGANTAAFVTGTLELTPSFPASDPLVLAAGGTEGNPYGGQYGPAPGSGGTFTCAAHETCNTGLVVINGGAHGCGTAARPGEPTSCYPVGYGGEQTWQEALTIGLGTTSGGGISSLYPVPFYQHSVARHAFTTLLGNQIQATGRMTPDVSFNAAVYGGVLAYLGFLNGGVWAVFGGTSAASPAWAAIIALANQANGGPLGFVNPMIYSLGNSNAFHDITVGNNAICTGLCGEDGFVAGHGYDLTTGWGTPNVSNLINALTSNNNQGGYQGR